MLSFQGPSGGSTFPPDGLSLHWFEKLYAGGGIVGIGPAFRRSLKPGLAARSLAAIFPVLAGLAFR